MQPIGWNALPDSYRIPESAPSLVEARAYCQRLARSHYENFSVATWFLPARLRQHFYNVYSYCRISDDLGDEVGDARQSLAMLAQWEEELNSCYAGTPRHPVFVALAETVREFGIPKHEFSDLLVAFRQDQTITALRPSTTFSTTAIIPPTRSAISSSTSAATATPSGRSFPIPPAPRCNCELLAGCDRRLPERPRLPAAGRPAPLRGRG